MELAAVPEITPQRFDVTDVAGFKAHLTEHGFAVVNASAPAYPRLYMGYMGYMHANTG
jgi:hypothetical protein